MELSVKTDEELVSEVFLNNDVYSHLIERYKEKLQRYIIRIGCKNQSDVEDILQEIFIKAFINLKDFDKSLKFSSWIYRIAHNETINLFRKTQRQPLLILSNDDDGFFNNIKSDIDIIKDYATAFEVEYIKNAINALDIKYRDPLILKFFEEKSYIEISDILKIPEGTVATYINRGKAKLKEELTKLRNN